MKRQWCSVLIAFVLLSVIPSIAQCGMYTYQNVTADSSGNLIGDNLVQATSCKESSTYADAHLTMPSGAQFTATAYGADVAEAVAQAPFAAVAQAPFANESGSGSFSGNHNASSDLCGFSDGSTFNLPIIVGGAYTKEVWIGGQLLGVCAATIACTNTAIPQCRSNGVVVGPDTSCPPAWNTYWGTYRIGSGPVHCLPIGMSLPTNDTSPEWCTPAQ